MGDKCLLWENKFEWEIFSFWKKKNLWIKKKKDVETRSRFFEFGKYNCYLEVGIFNEADITDYFSVFLKCDDELVNYKKSCKLCLIDGRDEEFFVIKRTNLMFNDTFEFMNIMVDDLDCDELDLLPEDVLTLRLAWCKEENGTCECDPMGSHLNSEKEQRKLLQRLSEDFGRIYEKKEDTDFLLKVGSEVMHVHRVMLSARSNIFAHMFRQAISEGQHSVYITNVDVGVLCDVLYYVYSGKTRRMSADTIVPMYKVAMKYCLIELMNACLNILMSNLAVENVCDAALLAHTRRDRKLKNKIVKFVKEKWEEIEQTRKWQEFSKSVPALAVELTPST